MLCREAHMKSTPLVNKYSTSYLGGLPPVRRDAQTGNPNPLHIIVRFLFASCLDGLPPVRRDAQIGNPNPLHIIICCLSASCLDGLPPVRRDV
jgi:hypothetical protein